MKLPLRIERLAKSGEGLAHHEGRAVFVAGALPEELVEVTLSPRGKVLRGENPLVLEPSPERREPRCALFGRCGGCDWLHASESLQRREKTQIVVSALEHLGHLGPGDYALQPMQAAEPSFGARRRAVLHVQGGKIGFFAHESRDLVEVAACPALTPPLQALLPTMVELRPVLRELTEIHLLESEGTAAAALWLSGARRPAVEERAERWRRAAGLAGVVLVPAEGPPLMLGNAVLHDGAALLRPDAFAQAHAAGNRLLVDAALKALELPGAESALELYAGNGNFTVPLAALVKRVVAVESSPVSQALARKVLGAHVRLMQQEAERAVQGMIAARERFDLLLADPPRSGAPGLGKWASELLVKKVVYVACDPAALARDAAGLVAHGFTPLTVQLFDLFPQTHHVEAVMAFERR